MRLAPDDLVLYLGVLALILLGVALGVSIGKNMALREAQGQGVPHGH